MSNLDMNKATPDESITLAVRHWPYWSCCPGPCCPSCYDKCARRTQEQFAALAKEQSE